MRCCCPFREESERVSELKGISGSTKLPYGALATGVEGIQRAITNFNDACVVRRLTHPCRRVDVVQRRKSDIENERLPPELIDPESEQAKPHNSATPTSSSGAETPVLSNGVEGDVASGPLSAIPGSMPISGPSPDPGRPTDGLFRPGHVRQQSLGTTQTSPSTRRRSFESTISLIKEAVEKEPDGGKQCEGSED